MKVAWPNPRVLVRGPVPKALVYTSSRWHWLEFHSCTWSLRLGLYVPGEWGAKKQGV